jgi:hypothetical protein
MFNLRRTCRSAVIAVTIAAMLTVSGCAWFRGSIQQQQIAFIGTVFAATYILTMSAALANRAVAVDEVMVYKQIHGYRTLQLVTSAALLILIVQHFNLHRALWWPLPIWAVILHSVPGFERVFRDNDQRRER